MNNNKIIKNTATISLSSELKPLLPSSPVSSPDNAQPDNDNNDWTD